MQGFLVKSRGDHILSSESSGSISSQDSIFSADFEADPCYGDDPGTPSSPPAAHIQLTESPASTPASYAALDTGLRADNTPAEVAPCTLQPDDVSVSTDLADCGTSLWRNAVMDSQAAVSEGFSQASQDLSAVRQTIKRWDTRAHEVLAHVHHVIHDTPDAAAEAAGAMMGRHNYHHPVRVRSLTPPATRCTTPSASPSRTWSHYLLSHLPHDDRTTTTNPRSPNVAVTATPASASGRILDPSSLAADGSVEGVDPAPADLAHVLSTWGRARGWSAPGMGLSMGDASQDHDEGVSASCSMAAGPQGSEILAEGLRTAARTIRHPHEVAQELASRISGRGTGHD